MNRKHFKPKPKAKPSKIALPPDARIPCGTIFGPTIAVMCKNNKLRTAK